MHTENIEIDTAMVNLDTDQLISKIIAYLEEVERYHSGKTKAPNQQEVKVA
jgi:hypothetical protein